MLGWLRVIGMFSWIFGVPMLVGHWWGLDAGMATWVVTFLTGVWFVHWYGKGKSEPYWPVDMM